jgi:hypothetical protein
VSKEEVYEALLSELSASEILLVLDLAEYIARKFEKAVRRFGRHSVAFGSVRDVLAQLLSEILSRELERRYGFEASAGEPVGVAAEPAELPENLRKFLEKIKKIAGAEKRAGASEVPNAPEQG